MALIKINRVQYRNNGCLLITVCSVYEFSAFGIKDDIYILIFHPFIRVWGLPQTSVSTFFVKGFFARLGPGFWPVLINKSVMALRVTAVVREFHGRCLCPYRSEFRVSLERYIRLLRNSLSRGKPLQCFCQR